MWWSVLYLAEKEEKVSEVRGVNILESLHAFCKRFQAHPGFCYSLYIDAFPLWCVCVALSAVTMKLFNEVLI